MDKQQLAVLIPIIVPIGAFIMIFGIKYLDNQERMAMIARGIAPPEKQNRFNPSKTLRNAAVLIGAGLGLLAAMIVDRTFYYGAPNDESAGFFFAFIALGAGSGLLTAYMYERKNPPNEI